MQQLLMKTNATGCGQGWIRSCDAISGLDVESSSKLGHRGPWFTGRCLGACPYGFFFPDRFRCFSSNLDWRSYEQPPLFRAYWPELLHRALPAMRSPYFF